MNEYSTCRLAIAPLELPETAISFAFRQGSLFVDAFDYVIDAYVEYGVTQRWYNYLRPPTECTHLDKLARQQLPHVTLNDLQGAFYILAIGGVLSFVALVLELALFKMVARHVVSQIERVDAIIAKDYLVPPPPFQRQNTS